MPDSAQRKVGYGQMESPTNKIFQSHSYQRLPLADTRLYCANNQVNFVDINGMDILIVDSNGNLLDNQSF